MLLLFSRVSHRDPKVEPAGLGSGAAPPGLAPKWNPQASGLAQKYSRLRLYFGA